MKYKLLIIITIAYLLTGCCCSNTPSSLDGYTPTATDYTVGDFALGGYTQPGSTNPNLGTDLDSTYRDLGGSPDGVDLTRTTPIKAKDSDHEWASSQPNYGYTIELARGEKASKVAKVLYKAPKAQRMAEIESQNGFVGVYGSYQTQDEAQKAYQALPQEIQQQAKIKSWSEVR